MHPFNPWRGFLVHTIFVLAQPTYLTIRSIWNPNFLSLVSTSWLAIHAIIWIYIVTQISIPFFTSPIRALPCVSGERFPIGHFRLREGDELFSNIETDYNETPNDGLFAVWAPFYLWCHVFPTRPDLLIDVLNTNNYDFEKPVAGKRVLGRVLGNGLINTEGNEHKVMRRVVAPAFSGRNMRDLVPLFYSKGLAFADSMAAEAKKAGAEGLEMMAQMSRVTLDIIGAAGVGKDFKTIENDDDPLAKLYATITDTDRGPILPFFLITAYVPPWLTLRLKGTVYAKIAKATVQLRQDVASLMQEKKQMMLEKSEQQKDIIATIMRSGDFSDEYLVNQLLTFLAAGHDTTASALTWTTWMLCQHPEVQDRLRAECNAHLATKHNSEIDASIFDAETMPYLTAVCNEMLRLYPTVPATSRIAMKPTKIGTQKIPLGTEVIIAPWGINRNRALWGDDAGKFNPDRWLQGPNAALGGALSPYAMVTFLHGPRSCIGQTFARIEMKVLLAILVMRFRFEESTPGQKVSVGGFITIKPQNGLKLKLHDLKAGAKIDTARARS